MNQFQTAITLLKLKIKLQKMIVDSHGIYEEGYRQGVRGCIEQLESFEDPVLNNNGDTIKNINPEACEDCLERV